MKTVKLPKKLDAEAGRDLSKRSPLKGLKLKKAGLKFGVLLVKKLIKIGVPIGGVIDLIFIAAILLD